MVINAFPLVETTNTQSCFISGEIFVLISLFLKNPSSGERANVLSGIVGHGPDV